MAKLNLILAIHNHQPAGNFEHVKEDAYGRAYLPFLQAVYAHKELRFVLHYSGDLLEWISTRHKDGFEILSNMVKEGRVEILSGGFYEPVLASIPDEDKIGQIKKQSDFIRDRLGYNPRGIWLAERIWEPHLPEVLSMADVEYLSVDDFHFKMVGLEENDLFGYFLTEEQGQKINIFPGNERMRYLVPFRSVEEVISYMRQVYERFNGGLITMADDGEKFGIWPGTYKHVYQDGWLDRFLRAIEENSEWLETVTFSEYVDKHLPEGLVYLPTASYREMGEWALPTTASERYTHTLNALTNLVGEEDAKVFLRGGFWRYFLVKYPEANLIHKRMLMISRKVHEAVKKFTAQSLKFKVKESKETQDLKFRTQSLLDELWQGQCNDAYWHGIFGGLYLPHLRSSLWRHLLKAERMADNSLGIVPRIEEGDIEQTGARDIFLSTSHYNALLSQKGGSLRELSLKQADFNILDILTRRPETYHEKIRSSHTSNNLASNNETKTIHERLEVKEEGIEHFLIYDTYQRASLIEHFLPGDTEPESFKKNRYQELGDFLNAVYSYRINKHRDSFEINFNRHGLVSDRAIYLEKTIRFYKTRPAIDVCYGLSSGFDGRFGIEFNVSFLGSPYSRITINDNNVSIDSTMQWQEIKGFQLSDDYLNVLVSFDFEEPVDLWHFPIETVSLSESGVERLYQGTCLFFSRELVLENKRDLRFTISVANDQPKKRKV